MNLRELEELLDQCEQANKVIIMKFGAPWCEPCRHIEPYFDQLMHNLPTVVVLKIDIDASPDIKNLFQVSKVPTFLCLFPTPPKNLSPQDLRLQGADPQFLEYWLSRIAASM
jgi:thiol-disulfide isomerase/thioredoxin